MAAVATKAYDQTLRAGRLQKLGRLGLATEIAPGRWRLDENLQMTLRQMGERGDIIKTMHRELARGKIERGIADYAIYDPADRSAGKLVGRVIGQGPSDELRDTWDFSGAVEDTRLLFLLGLDVANAAAMPEWSPGDEFEAARRKAIAEAAASK